MTVQPRHLRRLSEQRTRLGKNHLAGAFEIAEQALTVTDRKMLDFVKHGVRLRYGFLVAILLEAGAQFFIETRLLAAQFFYGFAGLVLETRLPAIHMVEAAGQLTGKFNVRQLILAHRHLIGTVDQNIGTHQQRVAKKTVG